MPASDDLRALANARYILSEMGRYNKTLVNSGVVENMNLASVKMKRTS
ncbi:hypothetical protein ACFSMW_14460 [Virgibacillus halophilus]|uniref:Uncharacterized protein n=1 Tax=Tigheibacillus halophilus TaxID=361280 RepID=A0ABU5C2E7_9BACI|nr:hypothetical protein [Virgibacillus halophilus]